MANQQVDFCQFALEPHVIGRHARGSLVGAARWLHNAGPFIDRWHRRALIARDFIFITSYHVERRFVLQIATEFVVLTALFMFNQQPFITS